MRNRPYSLVFVAGLARCSQSTRRLGGQWNQYSSHRVSVYLQFRTRQLTLGHRLRHLQPGRQSGACRRA